MMSGDPNAVALITIPNKKHELRSPVQTPVVVRNKDWCFQARVYNSCCEGLHNVKKFEDTEHSACICLKPTINTAHLYYGNQKFTRTFYTITHLGLSSHHRVLQKLQPYNHNRNNAFWHMLIILIIVSNGYPLFYRLALDTMASVISIFPGM
jgi:hypothetical protein